MERIRQEIDRLIQAVAKLDKQIESRNASRDSNPLVLKRALAIARIGGLEYALGSPLMIDAAELMDRIRALPSSYTAWSYSRMPQSIEAEVLERVLAVIEEMTTGEVHAEDRV